MKILLKPSVLNKAPMLLTISDSGYSYRGRRYYTATNDKESSFSFSCTRDGSFPIIERGRDQRRIHNPEFDVIEGDLAALLTTDH